MSAAPTVAAYDPRAHLAECDRCPLGGNVVVPPDPPRRALKLVVIGEGPGRMEERYGRAFVGPSGKMLDAALLEAGGHRQNAWVSNVTLCKPDDDKQLESAIACCAPRLALELSQLPANIPILSLGAGASRMTIGKSGIQKYRGFVWKAPEIKQTQIRNAERLYEKRIEKKRSLKDVEKALNSWTILKARQQIQGRIVIPTVHPAYILRGADTWLPVLRGDVKRAIRLSLGQLTMSMLADAGKFQLVTTAKAAKKALRGFSQLVNVDLETDGPDPMRAKITCVGIADVNDLDRIVLMMPWRASMVPLVKKFLSKRTVVTHNGPAFDVIVCAERHNIVFGKNEDTLVAHRSFASHMPQALAHVGSVYTDTGPWKLRFKTTEEKGAVAGFGVKEADLPEYCAADVRIGSLAWLRMQPELRREEAVYREDMQMAALYTAMQRTGILVDRDRQQQLSKKLKHRAAALVGEMRELLRKKSFSPGKTADIRKALYGQLKAPLWLALPTPTGLPSTAAIVLEALKDHDTRAGRLADFIIRWRSANDSRSEYLDVYIHTDGRVHPGWGQVETGRPRTRNPNILNIPRMEHCTGCGVKLLDGCKHGKTKLVDGVETFIECKKKEEPQPETQLRDIYVAEKNHRFVYFDLCLATGTEIDTPTGPTAIEKLNVGDLVFTYRAETRRPAIGRVTEKLRIGVEPTVNVTLDNGKVVRCTPDHKWLVCPERQDDDPVERKAADLKPGDRLLPLRKIINRGSKRHPAEPREYLYAHKAIEYSRTHVEVALTTYGPRPDGHDVHHLNENTLDNSPSNLEYKETSKHKSDHGKVLARRCWDTPEIREKMTAGLQRAAAEDPTWNHGAKNPRWGDRRRRRERQCDSCGTAFSFFAKDEGTRRFCSRKCYADGRVKGLNHKVVSVEKSTPTVVWSIGVDPDRNYALAAGVFVKNSQAEMRFAAHISGDPVFIESCSRDIHTANACILFPDGADLIRSDPKGKGARFRDIGKTCGFAVAYGAEAAKIFATLRSKGFDVSMDDVETMLDNLKTSYRVFYGWANGQVEFTRRHGYLRIPFSNRIRWVGHFAKPNLAFNTPIQGGVAGVMNKRLLLLEKRKTRNAKLIKYHYDAAIYETPVAECADMNRIIKEVWEEPILVESNGLSFVQKIDQKEGERDSDF